MLRTELIKRLIIMNEIQKFKAQRSVLKAQDGTYFRSPKDSNVWINRETKKAYKSRRWRDADPNNHADDFDRYFEEYDDRPERFVSQGKTYVRQGDTYYNVDAQGHPVSQVSNPQFNWVRDATGNMRTLIKAKPVAKPQANTPVDAGAAVKQDVVVTNKPRGGVRPDYTTKFNGMNFTDEEKKYMTDAGFDPTNAKSVQEFILSKASNANLGARKGAGIADGYWGDKSAAAFQALRNQGIFTPKVDAQEAVKPVSETPIDSPDFGYKSDGNYSIDQAGTLKANGIRDWSSLINYAGRNKDSDFTKLLSGYFGTDDISQWDRNKLETEAKIHGGYHGQDRSQLMGFMAGLQRKANDQYQAKRDAYQQIINSPEIQKQLGLQKFMLGNTGANTLGNQPGFNGNYDAGPDGTA